MKIRYERSCTGEYSTLHVEGVIRLEEEVLLVGKFENPIVSNYEKKYPIVVLGILQDVEDSEKFYMYETAIVKNGDHDPVTKETADFKTEEINSKIKYYLDEEKTILPWVHVARSCTGRYRANAEEDWMDPCRVMIPNGKRAESWDAPNEVLRDVLRDSEERGGVKPVLYDNITDNVKRADI